MDATELLLERSSQLARSGDLLADARDGSGRALVVEGPAGIGKTRLLAAIGDQAARAGFRVLTASGAELERGIAFGVARQLLEQPAVGAGGERDPAMWGGAARLAAPVFALDEATREPSDRFAVLHGLYWLTANLCDRSAVLLAIDDAHWSDLSSLQWLAYLARRSDGLRLAIVMARRSGGERGPTRLVVDELLDQGVADAMPLSPLTPPAVAEIVREHYDRGSDDTLCAACHDACGGNPFLLEELLATMRAELPEPTADAADRVAELSSPNVSRSVGLRLTQIAGPARELAEAIAVLGPAATLHQAAALARVDLEAAAQAADAMRAADILRADAVLDFVHPLVRTAVYSGLPPGAIRTAHARAARIVSEAGGEAERVAAHLIEAEPGADPWVVDRLRAAARRALEAGAPDAAVRYLTRALSEPPVPSERADVLLGLGVASLAIDTAAAVEHFTAARDAAADRSARAAATLWLAKALAYSGRSGEGVAAVGAALSEGHEPGGDVAARLERELFLWEHCWTGNPDRADTTRRLALAADGLRGSSPVERGLLSMRAWNLMVEGAPAADTLAVAERALGTGLSFTDPDQGFELPTLLGSVFLYCDAADRALEVYDGALAELSARGWVIQMAFGHAHRANVQFRRGALLDAEADAETSWSLTGELGPEYPAWWYAFINYVQALLARGEVERAAGVAESTGVGDYVPDAIVFPMPIVIRGRLRIATGDHEAGVADLTSAGDWMEERGLLNPSWSSWRMDVAPSLARLGRGDEARALVGEAIVRARRFGAPWALGSALRAAGELEGGDDGVGLLAESVAVLEPSPCRLELARSLVAYGAALRRTRKRAEARDPLRRGLDLAQRCGAGGLEREARDELKATGGRPRSGLISGVESLTPSELRVCRLAASGHSNPEIAQALFVTRRTVESHLASAYRKLAIHSRADLADALRSPD